MHVRRAYAGPPATSAPDRRRSICGATYCPARACPRPVTPQVCPPAFRRRHVPEQGRLRYRLYACRLQGVPLWRPETHRSELCRSQCRSHDHKILLHGQITFKMPAYFSAGDNCLTIDPAGGPNNEFSGFDCGLAEYPFDHHTRCIPNVACQCHAFAEHQLSISDGCRGGRSGRAGRRAVLRRCRFRRCCSRWSWRACGRWRAWFRTDRTCRFGRCRAIAGWLAAVIRHDFEFPKFHKGLCGIPNCAVYLC